MTTIWNPNYLAVAGIMLTLAGLGIFAKALLAGTVLSPDEAGGRRVQAQRRVDVYFALPLLALGLVLLAGAQLINVGLTPFTILTMIGLAFLLLMYGATEASLAESMIGAPAQKGQQKRLTLIAAPIVPAVAVLPAEPELSIAHGTSA